MYFDVKEFRNPKNNLIVGYVLNMNNTMFYLRNDEMQELLGVLTPVAEDFCDDVFDEIEYLRSKVADLE